MVVEATLIALAALAVLAVTLLLVARFKPERLAFLGRFVMRSKKVRKAAESKLATELASDPQMLEEVMGQQLSRSDARKVTKVLGNRSESETAELLGTLMSKAESGQQVTLEDLARRNPKSASEARAKAKKKEQARAKRRAAKSRKRR